MLQHLNIQNYALIKELSFSPDQGFNTITGETGAGKSILLGAIGLLLGNRADKKTLLDSEKKCIIEGTFNVVKYQLRSFFNENELDFDDECIIRREINTSGKSRAFINDTPVNLETLKSLGLQLIDIHSQHENLSFHQSGYIISILDAMHGKSGLVENYQTLYKAYLSKKKHYQELLATSQNNNKELDYKSFLYNELTEAKLNIEADTEIQDSLKTLENAGEIKSTLLQISTIIDDESYGPLNSLNEVHALAKKLEGFGENYKGLLERLNSIIIELSDVSNEYSSEGDNLDVDEESLVSARNRVQQIISLYQKHHVNSVEELVEIEKSLHEELENIENSDEKLENLKSELEKDAEQILKIAEELSKLRKNIASGFGNQLMSILEVLGMPDAALEVQFEVCKPNITGTDEITFLFSANKGIALQELKKVASGGEFSRLMFGIKSILANHKMLPTVIFDEIDTGISGDIAHKMAKLMAKMGQQRQIVSITHLPQIASKGNAHFFVFKDNSSDIATSNIKKLSFEEREHELAKMLSGENITPTALNNAKELLNNE